VRTTSTTGDFHLLRVVLKPVLLARIESLHRTAMIGTPEQVIERLRYYEQLGVDEFSFWCDNSLPHDEKRKSLELFIKEVTPAFV
jgi:flavin-dependent trigonelline monooxygenase, oxygenase component